MDWPTKIKVDRNLIPLLSRQTYADFYQVLREFINNSYDADATIVDIKFNYHDKIFEISDNGRGMSPEQFEGNFLTIAQTSKIPGQKTSLGRSVIGQFGVGFVSASQFCDKLIIESSTINSERTFEAVIDCNKFFEKGDRAKGILIGDIPVHGRDFKKPSNYNKQYTKITLEGLTLGTMKIFDRKTKTRSQTSITNWSGYDTIKWQLQQTLPLEYPEDSEHYSKHLKYDWGTPMNIYLNGMKLERNLLTGDVVEFSKEIQQVGNIKFKYVIMTPWKPVMPYELAGLEIRLNNVGIGLPNLFGFTTRTGKTYMITKWVCGEIQIIEGLQNQLKLDRTDFSESEEYIKFYHYFRDKIISLSNDLEDRRPKKRILNRIEKEIFKNQEKLIQKQDIQLTPEKIISKSTSPEKSLVQRLKENLGKGVYEIKEGTFSGDLTQSPVTIDSVKKKAKIVRNHPAFYDHMEIDDIDYILEYEDVDDEKKKFDDIVICKIDNKNKKIILNKNFKLFHDKKHGEFYKQLFSILEYTRDKYPKEIESQKFIKNNILKIYLGDEA